MNARDIVTYGQKDVDEAFKDLPDDAWSVVGVTTSWTLRDLLGHLASFELLLEESLRVVAGDLPAPVLYPTPEKFPNFNTEQVAARADRTPQELALELADAHARVLRWIENLGPARLREPDTIPWYGAGYSLDDMIVYMNYGHKREHTAQAKVFRRKLGN